jgi:hypothetical protein
VTNIFAHHSKWKPLALTLSIIVVFITTYALILPAMTLDQETARQQGGIDIAVEEQQDAASAKAGQAPSGEAAEETASEEETNEAAEDAAKDAAKDAAEDTASGAAEAAQAVDQTAG